jgi:UDP-N-acetylmuramate--alanine ligase
VDLLFITDIYPAGEPYIKGIEARRLSEAIKRESNKNTQFLEKRDIINTLSGIVRSGDLVIFLGAGDITKVCDDFIEKLSAASLANQK